MLSISASPRESRLGILLLRVYYYPFLEVLINKSYLWGLSTPSDIPSIVTVTQLIRFLPPLPPLYITPNVRGLSNLNIQSAHLKKFHCTFQSTGDRVVLLINQAFLSCVIQYHCLATSILMGVGLIRRIQWYSGPFSSVLVFFMSQ